MRQKILLDTDDKEEETIDFIQRYEPPEGYFVGFSGGKDSIVLLDLVKRSGVKYKVYYSCTGIDPPEVVKFIRDNHPEDDPKFFSASWITGCISAMNENLRGQEMEREENKASANAITLYKQEIDVEYRKLSSHFRTVKTSGSRGFSSSGYAKGKEAGSNISLGSKPIGSGRKQLKG